MEAGKKRPTKKQYELLRFIDGFIKGHGYGPSYREIMRALNYKSVSTVAIHVDNLIVAGHVKKRDHSARSLEVLQAQPGSTTTDKPVNQAQSKWLVDLVTQRFIQAEQQPTPKKVDELYVLVGALHILGLQDAHTAAKARLAALTGATQRPL